MGLSQNDFSKSFEAAPFWAHAKEKTADFVVKTAVFLELVT